ncbi:hypothetical protein NDU88_005191 [Pleurodeles waltl]|uniref:Uncharacterized protein n=1 Tax=Pleurodeles waltl TaxID=8319 RepID=A0AAV7WYT6_PLEWA|nr:hypothetical protein NDU88_005191 [Pleurodeles waltl]
MAGVTHSLVSSCFPVASCINPGAPEVIGAPQCHGTALRVCRYGAAPNLKLQRIYRDHVSGSLWAACGKSAGPQSIGRCETALLGVPFWTGDPPGRQWLVDPWLGSRRPVEPQEGGGRDGPEELPHELVRSSHCTDHVVGEPD